MIIMKIGLYRKSHDFVFGMSNLEKRYFYFFLFEFRILFFNFLFSILFKINFFETT